MVFKTVRLFETPSLGKDLLTSLPVQPSHLINCTFDSVCVRHTSSIYFPFKGICQITVFS